MATATAPASDHRASREVLHGQRHDRILEFQPEIDDDGGRDEPVQISTSQRMLSALSGSVLTSLLVTPLDVVRVRLQAQYHPQPATPVRPIPAFPATFSNLPPNLGISACCREVFWINNNAPYCVAGPNVLAGAVSTASGPTNLAECSIEQVQRTKFTSTFDGLRKIAQNEGPRTLWRGLSPTLAMAVPANVIYFAGYDWLRTNPKSPFNPSVVPDAYAPLAAGSSARILAAISVSPIEMFRTRMQAAHTSHTAAGHFRETLQDLHELVQAQGYRVLWRGLTLTLWRDVPFSAIYWWGYETGRNWLVDARERQHRRDSGLTGPLGDRGMERVRRRSRSRSRENSSETLVDSFAAGACSGAFAALITTPFDVGKTRRQVVQHAKDTAASAATSAVETGWVRPEDRAMPKFLWHIFKEQGLPGLFRGWLARCLKVAPACAIMISSYEIGKKMAGSMNERRDQRRLRERD